MNRSLEFAFHGWRGIGADEQPDLFVWRRRFGFLTVSLCRVCLLTTIHKLRATIRQALEDSDDGGEGR